MMQMKFRLFGAHTGKTIVLSGTYFENGMATVVDTPENIGHLERALMYYRAYSEGSVEYNASLLEEEENGNRSETTETAGSGDSERLLGEHGPTSGGTPDETPTPGNLNAESETRDEGPGSNGGGHEHSGVAQQSSERDNGAVEPNQVEDRPQPAETDEENSPQPVDPNARDIDWKLINIIEALDPDTDDHWTQAGLPAIAAVEESYGSGDVTRALVEKAKPGWTRELAADEKASLRSNDIEF